ncbi:hypothetical protein LTS07_010067 [Exophiala sideris]|uniref:RING-type domain-containing protein n=1 Tax=Exophiala sideris TaxID=1016849 RepID=A0ABR0IXM3_9EURO|nr:hypothetical protein LTS07_010067 [Exophiala sideris]KAK5051261.1 hypothetical protein LTR69_010287 [Exophiala sideris]
MSQASDALSTADERKSRSNSVSSSSTQSTVADTIEWQAERATKDLLQLTASLREYKDKLKKIIQCHPTLTDKQKKTNSKVLDSVNHALIHNRFDLRQTFSVLTITTVGARYAAAKELIRAVEARLDAIEAQAVGNSALRATVMQLQRTEARLAFKQAVLQAPLEETHGCLDVHDLVSSLLVGTQAGSGTANTNEIKLRQVVVVSEDSRCIICSEKVGNAPECEIQGARSCSPVLCPHCKKPMHIACQCARLGKGKNQCPDCQQIWDRETMVENLTVRITQLKTTEKNCELSNASKRFWGANTPSAKKRAKDQVVKDECEEESNEKRLKVDKEE